MAEGRIEEISLELRPPPINMNPGLPPASEEERHLSTQATHEFDKGKYDACLATLNKLAVSRGVDPKVLHNQAVAEYSKTTYSKTDEFKAALANVCSKARVTVSSLASLEDVDQCVIFYNYAVILYHLKQYNAALTLLDKLFQFIEPMEEKLSKKVMFLLAELYLCTHQPEKAMGMLAFIEKILFGEGTKSGSGSGSPEKEKEKDVREKEHGTMESLHVEAWKAAIGQFKARGYMMLKSLKSCKREVKCLMNSKSAGMSTSVVYLKSCFEYMRGNYRKAIKVLNSATIPPKSVAESGECLPVMYYNNLGIIHFHMKKHNLGAFYFRKAVQENTFTIGEFKKMTPSKSLSGKPLHTWGVSRHYELLYNMGVQQLHCGQPTTAFDCLIGVVNIYQINPRLWLRLAECCIMAHQKNNDEDRRLSMRLEVVQGTVGTGVHRKLILGSGTRTEDKDSPRVSESAAIPMVTLEFASLCLRNALLLLPDPQAPEEPPTEDSAGEPKLGESLMVQAPPGNPMSTCEVANLRCSILASSAFVALCLNDHLVALQHANQLLQQPRLSGALRYLGHMYNAEALVGLDRIADAVSNLNTENVTDVTTPFPEQKQEIEKNGDKEPPETTEIKGALYPWTPSDVPRAQAIMQYNLATAHAIRGEYEKALGNLDKCSQGIGAPFPAQMYYLKLYLELMEGNRKTARAIIKEHFGHVTPNRV